MCDGCYVPKWFEDTAGNNKCIPYGFRFKQQTGWNLQEVFVNESSGSDTLTVEDAQENQNDINLTVYPNNTALLSLEIEQGVWRNIYLEQGKDYDWKSLMGITEESNINYILHVDEIFYNQNYLDSFISVSMSMVGYQNQQLPATIDAYCDMDGEIKMQKTKDPSTGGWAACQNNYECDSNLCSSGECVEILDMTGYLEKFRIVGIQIFCKFANLFSIEGYDQCVINYS